MSVGQEVTEYKVTDRPHSMHITVVESRGIARDIQMTSWQSDEQLNVTSRNHGNTITATTTGAAVVAPPRRTKRRAPPPPSSSSSVAVGGTNYLTVYSNSNSVAVIVSGLL